MECPEGEHLDAQHDQTLPTDTEHLTAGIEVIEEIAADPYTEPEGNGAKHQVE